MAGGLFENLPPPSEARSEKVAVKSSPINDSSASADRRSPPIEPPKPVPALKSALKRSKPPSAPISEDAPSKRLRFKTTTDASEKQVIEAMQKIASHIKNPAKFNKASKLAIQLIQAGSVKEGTRDYFFDILDAAMLSVTTCNEPSVRNDYHALFSAAQDVAESLKKKQQNLLCTWTIRAVWANDLFTDDSFVFSKATGKIKDAISTLPAATEDEDIEEADALKNGNEVINTDEQINEDLSATDGDKIEEEPDPFGLDALISNIPKKDEKLNKKIGESSSNSRSDDEVEEEKKRHLKLQREALISCLEIAAKRYKTPWCQTAIDILAKHAFDNISRFTRRQRDAVERLWASIREQQLRRKQGKSVSGKLDVNAFEWLQQKYSTEKISIRHSVGGSGDRKSQQWLG